MLLQIGFDGSLPWSFVATTPLSSSQIFEYIPQALKHALPYWGAKAEMFALEPYYNWQKTGYNATLAIFYFPREGYQKLKSQKNNPNSLLYTEEQSATVKALMSMIDSTIPLDFTGNWPSDDGDSSSGSSGSDGSSSSGSNSSDGSDDSNDGTSSSSKGSASSAGIAVGAVAGAAAYGAAMFWVARRYRKRKQLHQRSSSVDQMSQGSSVAGAGNRVSGSQRSQMISAPVMAENSLGWN
jgi:hypothetical protein